MEEWKEINGFNGRFSVSNLGRIRRNKYSYISKQGHLIQHNETILEPGTWQSKYLRIDILDRNLNYRLCTYVHKLVAEYFIGPRPDGYQIDHIDGNYLNNAASNLRYVTPSENINNPITVKRKRKSLKTCWANKSDEEKETYRNKMILICNTQQHRDQISKANKGRIPITNGEDYKRVKPDELNNYINKGYYKGYPAWFTNKLKAAQNIRRKKRHMIIK